MVVGTAFELRFGVSGQVNLPLWGLQVSVSAGGVYSQVLIAFSLLHFPHSSFVRKGPMSSWRCHGRGYARLTWVKMHSGGSAGSSAGSHFPCHARRLSWTSAPQEQVRGHVLLARDSWGWGQGEGDRVFQVIYTCSGFSLHNCERSVLRWPVSLPRVPSRRSTPSSVPWVI